MTRVLGIDGGGTQTRAILVDAEGRVLGRAAGRSINPRHHDAATLAQRLDTLVRDSCGARTTVHAAFLGLGGISTRAEAADVERIARGLPALAAARVTVDNDARAALSGGLCGRPGLVLIAGTGSACLGVAADGRRWWCGGWEALADDAGSAYWMAVEAIRVAVRQEDGRLPRSAIRDLVFGRWGLEEPRALAERLSRPDLDRAALAALAPDIVALSASDAAAAAIVERAVEELARLLAVTAHHACGGTPCDAILTGGLANAGPPFTPRLVAAIAVAAPAVRVVPPELPPAMGAVLEALKSLGIRPDAGCLNRLRTQAVDTP
jgi:N-acetylglucosamine kinase-like BadF-type ATPase